jgi:hypothetical protein
MSSTGGRRFERAAPATALALGCLVVALGVAGWPLASLAHQSVNAGNGGPPFYVFGPFGLVGLVVAWRRPLLVGVYAGLVLLATEVFRFHSSVAVAAATLVAAALFAPVRRRVQHVVDRRFNRARYDAERTVAAFADRLKDAVDLDAVRDDLAAVVQAALEPAHLSVWTNRLE